MKIVAAGPVRRNAQSDDHRLCRQGRRKCPARCALAFAAARIYLCGACNLSRGRKARLTMKDRLERLEQAQQSISANAPYQVSQGYRLSPHMVTTTFMLDGFKVVRNLGVVRGIT